MYSWGVAVNYTAYVLNRSPWKASPGWLLPIEILEGKPPNLLRSAHLAWYIESLVKIL
jgi:hypothetical protein